MSNDRFKDKNGKHSIRQILCEEIEQERSEKQRIGHQFIDFSDGRERMFYDSWL